MSVSEDPIYWTASAISQKLRLPIIAFCGITSLCDCTHGVSRSPELGQNERVVYCRKLYVVIKIIGVYLDFEGHVISEMCKNKKLCKMRGTCT